MLVCKFGVAQLHFARMQCLYELADTRPGIGLVATNA